jgi:hypothetical protein
MIRPPQVWSRVRVPAAPRQSGLRYGPSPPYGVAVTVGEATGVGRVEGAVVEMLVLPAPPNAGAVACAPPPKAVASSAIAMNAPALAAADGALMRLPVRLAALRLPVTVCVPNWRRHAGRGLWRCRCFGSPDASCRPPFGHRPRSSVRFWGIRSAVAPVVATTRGAGGRQWQHFGARYTPGRIPHPWRRPPGLGRSLS